MASEKEAKRKLEFSKRCDNKKKYTDNELRHPSSDDEFWSQTDEDEVIFLSSSSSSNSFDDSEKEEAIVRNTLIENRNANHFHWSTNNPGQPVIHFEGQPGFRVACHGREPIDFFRLLANEEFYRLVINETNAYARLLMSKYSHNKIARIHYWKELKVEEFEKFLGILFMTGQIETPDIPSLWKKNKIYYFPTIHSRMSRDRFLTILRSLQFSSTDTDSKLQHPLHKIKPLVDLFEKTMENIYYPEKNLSLDESMILWRGRLRFRQYMPGKKHKYGIKLYMLAQPDGLACRVHVYTGGEDPEVGGKDHVEKVVKKLVSPYLGRGHCLYMDNFYNSVLLTRFLMEQKTYATGTLRKSRKGNPPEVVHKKIKRGEIVQQFTNDGICILKWKDKRDVLIISSEHDGHLEKYISRGREIEKPAAVIKYNTYMGGVDRSDQLLAYYPAARKSLRWSAKVGLHIFHLMMNNSYLLYRAYTNKNIKLIDFRNKVIEVLLGDCQTPIDRPEIFHTHTPIKLEHSRTSRKKCRVCAKGKIVKNTPYICNECDDMPGLCLGDCFKRYHNYQ